MYKIHLCNPRTWERLAIIDQNKGDLANFIMKLGKNKWYQLEMIITAEFSRYDYVKDSNDFGVRIETENLDLGFVFYKKEILNHNRIKCNLFGSSYRLYTTLLSNKDRVYNGSLATFLGQLSTDYVFTPIGSDIDTIITTGVLDNFELLKESIMYKENFEFIEIGLKDTGGGNYKPEILYGDFSQIESYYNTTSDERVKPLKVSNIIPTDNSDSDLAFLDSYSISQPNEPFTLLYAFSQTGQGASANSRVELTNANASYINPQFPLVANTSGVTGDTTYYVRNPYAVNYEEKIRVYSPLESTISFDETGQTIITDQISPEKLYKKAVAYIQAYSGQGVVKTELAFKKLVLPGTLAKVNFKETYKKDDGTTRIEEINTNVILDDLYFDLETIQD